MIADDLLGAVCEHFSDAAQQTRYKKRGDKSVRVMGGYNVMLLGDLFQLAPIPSSAAIFGPPTDKKTEQAKVALNLFWGVDADALNRFFELDEQQRLAKSEHWYGQVLNECRNGALSAESFNFLMGLPTEHSGCHMPDGTTLCSAPACRDLPLLWRDMRLRCTEWTDLSAEETCSQCRNERERRNRLVEAGDPRVLEEPFLSAPYIHRNNVPKYHAMLLRAEEHAKRTHNFRIWFAAQDTPCNPAEIGKNPEQVKAKLARFLQFHDQQTEGIPGLCLLYPGLQMRVTAKIMKNSKVTILKHTPCTVVGWELHSHDKVIVDEKGERFLTYQPKTIFVKFENCDWQIGSLPPGVFPMFPVTKTWDLNKQSGVKVRRKGYTLVPDFACTAFMMQGTSLPAALADCGDVLTQGSMSDMMTAYVILSRVKKVGGLLLLRVFLRISSSMASRQGRAAL